MKFQFNRRYTTIAIYAFLVFAAAILFNGAIGNLERIGKVFSFIAGLLTPFIYGFAIAYLLNPVLKFIEVKGVSHIFKDRIGKRAKRGISLCATYLFAACLIAVFVGIVLPQIALSISTLISKLANYMNSVDQWLPFLLSLLPEIDYNATVAEYFSQYADQIAKTAYSMLTQAVPWMMNLSSQIAGGFLKIIVGVIISVYMLMDKERFCAGSKRAFYAALPQKHADWFIELTGDANHVFGGFINGKLLDSLIIGIICFLGMSLLKMPNIMLVSVIVGVTNVIPYFGPFIGAIPSFFIILIESPIKALWFLLFILVLQQFDGNILGPKILGDSTGLSAFWVIFSIMLFGGIYGFTGMLLGVPIFSVFYMLILRLISAKLKQRNMPSELDSYTPDDSPILYKHGENSENRKKRSFAHKVKPLGKMRAENLGEDSENK